MGYCQAVDRLSMARQKKLKGWWQVGTKRLLRGAVLEERYRASEAAACLWCPASGVSQVLQGREKEA
jgi:hypothetical protein